MSRLRRCLAAAVLLPLLAGCGGGGKSNSTTAPPPLPDAIIIASISPAQGTKLPPGGTVSFQVTCNYRLVSAATGVVLLTIADGAGNTLSNGASAANVTQGENSVQFGSTVTIPASITMVNVTCTLQPNGTGDVLSASVNYGVGS